MGVIFHREGWTVEVGIDGGFLVGDEALDTSLGWLTRGELVSLHTVIGEALELAENATPDSSAQVTTSGSRSNSEDDGGGWDPWDYDKGESRSPSEAPTPGRSS